MNGFHSFPVRGCPLAFPSLGVLTNTQVVVTGCGKMMSLEKESLIFVILLVASTRPVFRKIILIRWYILS